MYETEADRYKVDTLLLSCRVLGRGVEHALLAGSASGRSRKEKRFVEFTYLPTGKNVPALEFITSIGDQYRNEAGTSWTFPAERLASVEYDPDEKAPAAPSAKRVNPARRTQTRGRQQHWTSGVADRSERLQRIGENLYDIDRLAKAIEEYRLRSSLSMRPWTSHHAARWKRRSRTYGERFWAGRKSA